MEVQVPKELLEAAELARAELAARTPEENRRTAVFIREAAPILKTQRQREIAEEMAQSFEARADAAQSAGSSPDA